MTWGVISICSSRVFVTIVSSQYSSLYYKCHHHQHMRCDNGNQPKQAERFLPEFPAPSVLHSFWKEPPERIDRRLPGKAIINVLIVFVRFEPELIGVAKEQRAEEQKDKDKARRRLCDGHICSGKNSLEPAAMTNWAAAKIIVAPRATCFAESAREPDVIPAATPAVLQMATT